MNETGKKIVELRQKREITQKQLADYLGIGVPCLSLWESGKREVSAKMLTKLSKFFNVSIDYLLGITPQELLQLGKEERELIELIKELDTDGVKELSRFIDFILSSKNSKK